MLIVWLSLNAWMRYLEALVLSLQIVMHCHHDDGYKCGAMGRLISGVNCLVQISALAICFTNAPSPAAGAHKLLIVLLQ